MLMMLMMTMLMMIMMMMLMMRVMALMPTLVLSLPGPSATPGAIRRPREFDAGPLETDARATARL
eukprot:4490541-Pyramimonas_sp.AAC.1